MFIENGFNRLGQFPKLFNEYFANGNAMFFKTKITRICKPIYVHSTTRSLGIKFLNR